jgi:hypothetical protein
MKAQKKKTWSLLKILNNGEDCNNKSFRLKEEEKGDEEREKKVCTRNVRLCNESDGVRTHVISYLALSCCAVPVCDTCIAGNGKVTGE